MPRLFVASLLLIYPLAMFAQDNNAASKWEKEIAGMEQRYTNREPAPGGIVFVGSSSIRLWNLDKFFAEVQPPPLNHGFGGSEMADSLQFIDRLVLRFKPKIVVVYAGDNDLAKKKTPEEVATAFGKFCDVIQEKLPETRVIYLAIKPSPARWKLFDAQTEANTKIKAIIAQRADRVMYLDVVGAMLNEQGEPKPEIFKEDKLHMNDDGYAIWTKLLLPHLSPVSSSR